MKKFLLAALMALGLALTSQQEAKAWINCKFSVGLNWSWQSGGNSVLWGLFHNGQAPPAFQFGPPPPGYPPPNPNHYGPQEFQYFGQQPQKPGLVPTPVPTQTVPVPAPANSAQQQAYSWDNARNPYMAVNYFSGNYFAPGAGPYSPGYYGYFQTPSYWYSR